MASPDEPKAYAVNGLLTNQANAAAQQNCITSSSTWMYVDPMSELRLLVMQLKEQMEPKDAKVKRLEAKVAELEKKLADIKKAVG